MSKQLYYEKLCHELAGALRNVLKTTHWVLDTVPKDHWWFGEYKDLSDAQIAEEEAHEILAKFDEVKK